MFVNNKCTDQPAHPRRLISALVIRLLESILSKLTMGEILFFWLVIVAEGIDLSLALSETREKVLQSFFRGRESWLLYNYCLKDVLLP